MKMQHKASLLLAASALIFSLSSYAAESFYCPTTDKVQAALDKGGSGTFNIGAQTMKINGGASGELMGFQGVKYVTGVTMYCAYKQKGTIGSVIVQSPGSAPLQVVPDTANQNWQQFSGSFTCGSDNPNSDGTLPVDSCPFNNKS